ncbi:DUF4143 domain-containing protein [Microbacterium karelineae]|uniref:DUF4143 domain-containing protein n=1 Tax=Microbacterium karelineae TaxID=2654283 RepID=UPI0012EA4FCB
MRGCAPCSRRRAASSRRACGTPDRAAPSNASDRAKTAILEPSAAFERHPSRGRQAQRLIESLARHTASEASLAKDVSGDGGTITPATVRSHLDGLARVFAFEELPAWSVALRSRSRLRSAPKLLLTEPALACAALGIGIDRLASDPEFFDQVFEAKVVRDVRSLASVELGRVHHCRDNTGLEADAFIEQPDGRWVALEVELGSSRTPRRRRTSCASATNSSTPRRSACPTSSPSSLRPSPRAPCRPASTSSRSRCSRPDLRMPRTAPNRRSWSSLRQAKRGGAR